MKINLSSFYSSWLTKSYVFCRNLILPLSEIDSLLPDSGLVFDIGCGFGLTSIYFAVSSSSRKVIGLDISQKRIQEAKLASQNISNLNFKIDNLASHQHKIANAIIVIDIFHHIDNNQKKILLNQCHHLLLPKGKLIIKDINTKPFLFYLWNYLHDLVFNFNLGSTLDFLNYQQMTKILNQHQFKVINHYPLTKGPYPHYLYVCQKK